MRFNFNPRRLIMIPVVLTERKGSKTSERLRKKKKRSGPYFSVCQQSPADHSTGEGCIIACAASTVCVTVRLKSIPSCNKVLSFLGNPTKLSNLFVQKNFSPPRCVLINGNPNDVFKRVKRCF